MPRPLQRRTEPTLRAAVGPVAGAGRRAGVQPWRQDSTRPRRPAQLRRALKTSRVPRVSTSGASSAAERLRRTANSKGESRCSKCACQSPLPSLALPPGRARHGGVAASRRGAVHAPAAGLTCVSHAPTHAQKARAAHQLAAAGLALDATAALPQLRTRVRAHLHCDRPHPSWKGALHACPFMSHVHTSCMQPEPAHARRCMYGSGCRRPGAQAPGLGARLQLHLARRTTAGPPSAARPPP